MGKRYLTPMLAVAGGAVGFGLRKWQLLTGFEPDTGLAVPGTAAAGALMGWTVLIALLLVALNRQNKERMGWDRAFAGARGNTVFMTAVILGAFLLLASAGAEAVTFSVTYQLTGGAELFGARMASAALPPLRIGLNLLGLPCVILWVRSLNLGGDKGKESLFLLELCLLFCVWLISDYQVRASDPVVQDYVYEVFAIVCGLMGIYYVTSYSFQEGKPRRTLFFCLMGAYFSLVTLADAHSLAEIFRYGFAVLFLTAHAVLLLQEHPPAPETEEAEETETPDPAEPGTLETEADDHA